MTTAEAAVDAGATARAVRVIGTRVTFLREEDGMTQNQLASRAGVRQSVVGLNVGRWLMCISRR